MSWGAARGAASHPTYSPSESACSRYLIEADSSSSCWGSGSSPMSANICTRCRAITAASAGVARRITNARDIELSIVSWWSIPVPANRCRNGRFGGTHPGLGQGTAGADQASPSRVLADREVRLDVADAPRVLRDPDGGVPLDLGAHLAGQEDDAVARVDVDRETLHHGVVEQLGLDPHGDTSVIDVLAHGTVGLRCVTGGLRGLDRDHVDHVSHALRVPREIQRLLLGLCAVD